MFVFLTTFLLLFAVIPDRDFSEAENRVLQKKPLFTWENLFSGKYSHAAEKYFADQFPGRDSWVGIKSATELLLQKKDNNGVYIGRGGYLLQKAEKTDKALLEGNIAAVNSFADSIPANIYLLLVPPAAQILEEKLPPFASAGLQRQLQKDVMEKLSPRIRLIEPGGALAAHREEYIYYKTDHHWTSLGAYYAYREAGPALGYTALGLDDFTTERVSDNFYGTLHAKSGHRFLGPDSIQLFLPKKELPCWVEYEPEKRTASSLYEKEYLQKKDKYAVFLGGNHPLVRITAPNETGRKLLIIKDSYANALAPFLANHYDEIHLIDLRHFNADLGPYIEQHGFKEILLIYSSSSFAEEPSLRKIRALGTDPAARPF